MNISLSEADVVAGCQKAGVPISAIETLASGGTHLVTVTSDGAAIARKTFAKNIIEGKVKRFAFLHARTSPLN